MRQVRPSNYEIMRDRMEMEFIKYDQAKMIQNSASSTIQISFIFVLQGGNTESAERADVWEWYSDTKATQAHMTAIQKPMPPRHRKTQTQSAVLCDIRGEQ